MKTENSSPVSVPKDPLRKEPVILQQQPEHRALPEYRAASVGTKGMKALRAFSSPNMKQVLTPLHKHIQAAQHADAVIGKAAFYILALLLALGIVALAVYFLPSILLPAQVVTTFSTILLIGVIVLLCLFVFLIYTLIHLLIDLFKHKKALEEDAFEEI